MPRNLDWADVVTFAQLMMPVLVHARSCVPSKCTIVRYTEIPRPMMASTSVAATTQVGAAPTASRLAEPSIASTVTASISDRQVQRRGRRPDARGRADRGRCAVGRRAQPCRDVIGGGHDG